MAAALALVGVSVAQATWSATGTGNGYARATALPSGTMTGASASGHTVSLSWSAETVGGSSVSDYIIRQYDLSDVSHGVNTNCDGFQGGTSCTENSVAAGDWQYTVTPHQGNWSGGESSYSRIVHVMDVPTGISCTNCSGGVIDGTNQSSVDFQVSLPASSEAGGSVHLSISDGSNTINPSTQSATTGAGSVNFTGIDCSSLASGSLTVTAWVTNGSDSSDSDVDSSSFSKA